MHISVTTWQEDGTSRLPAERLWLIANPLDARRGDFCVFPQKRHVPHAKTMGNVGDASDTRPQKIHPGDRVDFGNFPYQEIMFWNRAMYLAAGTSQLKSVSISRFCSARKASRLPLYRFRARLTAP